MSRVALRDGLELAVEDDGRGPALLLVHGFTGGADAWGEELKTALRRELRVLAVDLLGHGDSDRCHDPKRYALPELVEDLTEVLDAAGLPAVAWAGYSMGGRIALAAALLRPARVRALVLEGASPGLAGAAEREARRAHDEELAARLEREGAAAFVEHWLAQPLFATQRRLPAELRAAERERRLRHDPGSLAACLRGASTGAQPSFWERLGELRAPALLLTGELDNRFSALGLEMARLLPRARVARVARSGHAVHLEAPRAWLAAVGPFVQRCGTQEEKR
jgi:2-succinyl-6-hydroxy-2,4-cyclohexadiene-1-carboxylate synthase